MEQLMLSTQTRLRLEGIANKIKLGEEVSLSEMIWAEKWAKANRSAAEIISKARRIAVQGEAHPDTTDGLLQALDLGNSDPSSHIIGPTDPDTLVDFFKPNDNDRMTRD
jgi:hypothetical protein